MNSKLHGAPPRALPGLLRSPALRVSLLQRPAPARQSTSLVRTAATCRGQALTVTAW